MPSELRPSPLGLTILGVLVSGPLHPYAIQSRMKFWGKDKVVNVGQRANLYKTIERLREAGLVSVAKVERDQRFPERTVYALTEEGLQVGREWLTEMLATPRNEFPEFPAALSFIFGLTPEEARAALERRAERLRNQLQELERELNHESAPPLLFLLETDYLRRVTEAELGWVDEIAGRLRSGSLSWSEEELREVAGRFPPPD